MLFVSALANRIASRAVSVALHTPQLGEPMLTQGSKIQSRHHLTPKREHRITKLKYKTKEISEVGEPFERKVLIHYAVNVGHFESKVFSHFNYCWGPI